MPPELSGVYGRLHESQQSIETGVELVLEGNEMAGRNELAAATTRLFVAARECAETPGCDIDLFGDAMLQLVAERRRSPSVADPPGDPSSIGDPLPAGAEADPPLPLDGDPLASADSLLTGAALRDLIPQNRWVRAALNDWLTWNRPALVEAFRNYQFLRPSVAPIYAEAGLPEALLFAMMAKESGAKVHAYSRAGAAGPLQFMGRTAQQYGLGSDDGFDLRLDPAASTGANARYMKRLLRTFGGNLELALAAYNLGDTRLRRLLGKHPGAGFWDPRVFHALPWETRNYVPKVLAVAWLFLHPDEYSLELASVEASATSIVLQEDTSLGELSICLGQVDSADGWFRTLRNLNPRISPSRRALAGTRLVLPTALVSTYGQRCVGDSPLIALARELHDADYPETPELMPYTVRRGDTLGAIATRHRCSLSELARLNGIMSPNYVIHVGQKLTVPARG